MKIGRSGICVDSLVVRAERLDWRRRRGRGVTKRQGAVGRITNLILQMDPKTWKQWNI